MSGHFNELQARVELLALLLVVKIVRTELHQSNVGQGEAVVERLFCNAALTVHVNDLVLRLEGFFKEDIDLTIRERRIVNLVEWAVVLPLREYEVVEEATLARL